MAEKKYVERGDDAPREDPFKGFLLQKFEDYDILTILQQYVQVLPILPTYEEKFNGRLVFVTSSNEFFIGANTEWTNAGETGEIIAAIVTYDNTHSGLAAENVQDAIDEIVGSGYVVGPSSAVDENLAVFDGTTGKVLKDSGINQDSLIVGGDVDGDALINVKNIQLLTDQGAQAHSPGKLSWEPITGTGVMDTAYADVRVNMGQELQIRFYNGTGTKIFNGEALNAVGSNIANKVFNVCLADASSAQTSSSIIGLATHDVEPEAVGLATFIGEVRDFSTSHLSTTGPTYISETPGALTNTRPKYPSNIVFMGGCVFSDANGIAQVVVTRFIRNDVSTSFNFTSQGISAGMFWKGGFYDWESDDITLTNLSTDQTLGTADRTYAAHIGIVPDGPGTVDTGQVGLRVTGIQDSETGVQVAAQTAIITDDITTLTLNTMIECTEKFSGEVTIETYIVSGSPTTWSVTFNYGYSKYEDFFNVNATVIGLQVQWQGNANDGSMNIKLFHHKPENWTYAATGFVPGNGVICERLVDQALASNVVNNQDGAYKRSQLDTYITSGNGEGLIVQIITGQQNTIQSMDLVVSAKSEDLF